MGKSSFSLEYDENRYREIMYLRTLNAEERCNYVKNKWLKTKDKYDLLLLNMTKKSVNIYKKKWIGKR